MREWSPWPRRLSRTCSLTCSGPPSSMRAARSASFGGKPARRFSSIKSWRCERTSLARCPSPGPLKKRFRWRLLAFTRTGIPHLYNGLRRFQSLRDAPGDTSPAPGFGFELLPSGFGQAIVFRAAVVLGVAPEGRRPTFFLHAVEGGKERAGFDHKRATGHLLDSA